MVPYHEVVAMLARVTGEFASMVNDNGWCDHSVGICYCEDQRLVREARDLLSKAS